MLTMNTTATAVPAPPHIQFNAGSGMKILTVREDGTIEFNPELNMDQAVKGFIEAVELAIGKPLYPRRVQDLLETNTKLLIRARTAENLLHEALDKIEPLTQKDEEFIVSTGKYLKEPWA